MIIIKTEEEIGYIRKACKIAAEALKVAGHLVKAGITTAQIEELIDGQIKKRGAKPAFKGYRGYKFSSCLSVNEEVVHGLPSSKVLNEGDIIGIDVGAIVEGYYGDVAETFPVGRISRTARKLIDTTSDCLEIAMKKAKNGAHLGDLSEAIEENAKRYGFSVVKDMFGHGVGKDLHEDPLVPNFGKKGTGPKLQKGMVFAIEPMLNVGGSAIETLEDGWTVVTADRRLSAHFEHTVLITDHAPEVLTRI